MPDLESGAKDILGGGFFDYFRVIKILRESLITRLI